MQSFNMILPKVRTSHKIEVFGSAKKNSRKSIPRVTGESSSSQGQPA